MVFEFDSIIAKAAQDALKFSPDDPRSRLAFQVGILQGTIRELCDYINFLEGELNEANAKLDRLIP